MNAIVRLKDFAPVAREDFGFTGSKLDFVAAPRPLQIVGKAGGTLPVHSHKAIVRMTDRGPAQVGIVGSDYKLVQHAEVFGKIEDALRQNIRPDLQQGVQVRRTTSYGGAFGKAEYVFPAFADALKVSDRFPAKFGYRVVAWNSLDGSTAVGLLSGLIDFYCTNGMIAGSLIGRKLRKHTSGFNIAAFEEQITDGLTIAQEEVRWLEQLAAKPLDTDKAVAWLKAEGFSERKVEQLMAQTHRETRQRGRNLFALVSAMTYYASHGDDSAGFGIRNTGSDHGSQTLLNREIEVQQAIRSDRFRQLLAA